MKIAKYFCLHLRFKDLVFIAIFIFVAFLVMFANYFIRNEILMMVVLGVAFFIFIAIQIEIYRRIQTGLGRIQINLAGVKERYLFMDILDVIRTRRSIRRFSPQPVKEEDVRKMLDAAR
jgi:Nitroreductase family